MNNTIIKNKISELKILKEDKERDLDSIKKGFARATRERELEIEAIGEMISNLENQLAEESN